MALIVDRRAALGGGPGTHALIVGVSSYPFLAGGANAVPDHWDMGQLTSTVSTAEMIVEWLLKANLPVPLATCRLLLSPSPGENPTHTTEPATVDNLLAEAIGWRTDASSNQDNVSFFYFAGHGVQRNKEDAVLCLHDFRKPGPVLLKSVDIATIRAGMSPAPGRENIARTQFYFVDACRVQPKDLAKFEPLQTTPVFDKDLAGQDDRSAPVFYSSISNQVAAAFPGRQTFFSAALLEALNGAAADSQPGPNGTPIWRVSISGLTRTLAILIDDINREEAADQTFSAGGQQLERAPLCLLPGPPTVDVELTIEPPEATTVGALRVTGDDDVVFFEQTAPLTPHPVKQKLPAGLYNVSLSFTPPHPPFVNRLRIQEADTPRARWKVQVA